MWVCVGASLRSLALPIPDCGQDLVSRRVTALPMNCPRRHKQLLEQYKQKLKKSATPPASPRHHSPEAPIASLRSSPAATPRGAAEARTPSGSTTARTDDERAKEMRELRQKDAEIQERDVEIRTKNAEMADLRKHIRALETQVQVHVTFHGPIFLCTHASIFRNYA